MVRAVVGESATLSSSTGPSGVTLAPGAAGTAHADPDGLALTTSSFKQLELDIAGCNLDLESGRRDAVTYAVTAGDAVIAIRVLIHPLGTLDAPKLDRAARRNSALSSLSDLRVTLHEHFNFNLRDDGSGSVPPHMEKYEFDSASHDGFLRHFLNLELATHDWFRGSQGIFAWEAALTQRPHRLSSRPQDYFVEEETIGLFSRFFTILLAGLGFPAAVPAGAAGHTLTTFCSFYISTLKDANGLPLLDEQYAHLRSCDSAFRLALSTIAANISSVLHHHDISSRSTMIALLADDCDAVKQLKALTAHIVQKRQHRALLGDLLPKTGLKAGVASVFSLKLSDSANKVKGKAVMGSAPPFDPDGLFDEEPGGSGIVSSSPIVGWLASRLKRPSSMSFGAEEEGTLGDAREPGSRVYSWLMESPTTILVSGYAWDLPRLAQHLGVYFRGPHAPCWGFILSACHEQNRPACCNRWGKPGHASADDTAHSIADYVAANRAQLIGEFAKPLSRQQRETLAARLPSPPASAVGKHRKLHGSQHFEQPSMATGGPSDGVAHLPSSLCTFPRSTLGMLSGSASSKLDHLPTPQAPADAATQFNILHAPLKTLARHVAPKLVIDEGGEGQCGPNTLAYLLGLVEIAQYDGPLLRKAVKLYVTKPGVLDRRTNCARENGRGCFTLGELIVHCMTCWPDEARGNMVPSVNNWAKIIGLRESWTDLAFIQVVADIAQVAIRMTAVDDLSKVWEAGVVLPCNKDVPKALIHVGMWWGRHLVAIVHPLPRGGGQKRSAAHRPSAPGVGDVCHQQPVADAQLSRLSRPLSPAFARYASTLPSGVTIEDWGADGSCVFHALARGLRGLELFASNGHQLRMDAMDHGEALSKTETPWLHYDTGEPLSTGDFVKHALSSWAPK